MQEVTSAPCSTSIKALYIILKWLSYQLSATTKFLAQYTHFAIMGRYKHIEVFQLITRDPQVPNVLKFGILIKGPDIQHFFRLPDICTVF